VGCKEGPGQWKHWTRKARIKNGPLTVHNISITGRNHCLGIQNELLLRTTRYIPQTVHKNLVHTKQTFSVQQDFYQDTEIKN
jgi:hypothetical protein